MGFLAWIVIGLIAGIIARAIYPGKQPGGAIITILLGMVGAVVGGWLGHALMGTPRDEGLSFMGIFWAVIGSLILLFVWSLFSRRGETHRRRTV